MLGKIFEGSLGQFIAPDPKLENHELEHEDDEEESHKNLSSNQAKQNQESTTWMEMLAPDPKYYGREEVKVKPGRSIMEILAPDPIYYDRETDLSDSEDAESSTNYATPTKSSRKSFLPSPTNLSENEMNADMKDQLQSYVLEAAHATAEALKSPTPVWEVRKNFFTLCCATKPLTEKQIKRMKKSLRKDPSLATSYSIQMGTLVPDGCTPLHAAARAGNLEAARVLLDHETTLNNATNYSTSNNEKNDTEVKKNDESNTTLASKNVEDNQSLAADNNNNDKDPTVINPLVKTRRLVSLRTTDIQGRQPLHIASEFGHAELVALFRERLKEEQNGVDPIGSQAPIDLSGRTPMGWACASREKNAKKNIKTLEKTLFSPGDKSICGPFSPALGRSSRKFKTRDPLSSFPDSLHNDSTYNNIEFGFAEMAGWRVEMEDAVCCHNPVLLGDKFNNDISDEGATVEEVGLFGVFDGHGDGGEVSRFIADNFLKSLQDEWLKENKKQNTMPNEKEVVEKEDDTDPLSKDKRVLHNTAFTLDNMLKEKGFQRQGGSTAVIALVKKKHVIVANIGDSRAILISRILEEEDEVDCTIEQATAQSSSQLGNCKPMSIPHIQVIPLSEDHKPNLPDEKSRIEKAGLVITTETLENETFHKIKLSKSSDTKLAVSRAFGDFDFKSNTDLPLDEQAVVCSPEFTTHIRGSKDQFLVLACDGIWDVMSNDEVGKFVFDQYANNNNELLANIGDELLKE